MIICYSNNFVLLHLQKTGGTSVAEAIEPFLQPHDLVIKDWTRLIFHRDGRSLSEHSTSQDAAAYLGDKWDGFNKVATVRNPITLMKSLYSYTLDVYDEHFRDSIEVMPDGSLKALRYAEQSGYGPDGFVDYLIAREYLSVAPQSDRLALALDGTIVDLSRLSEDWGTMTEVMGFPNATLPWKNTSNSKSVEFSDVTTNKIKKHFEKDYDVLPPITGANW